MGNYIHAARAVLSHWNTTVGDSYKIETTHEKLEGLIVSSWFITAKGGDQYVLKNVADRADDQASIASEISVLQHLYKCDVPVAVPMNTNDGRIMVKSEQGIFLLCPALPVDNKDVLYVNQERVYTNIGRALAKLHHAMASYTEQVDSWTMNLPKTIVEEAIPQIESALSGQSLVVFQQITSGFKSTLNHAFDDLPTQYIHGDCHGSNYLIYQGDVSGFIDLDHMPYGPRCYDIAYVIADFAKAPLFGSIHHENWLENFIYVLDGYDRVVQLTENEWAAIGPLMQAIQLMFAYWLFKYESHEAAHKNLESFYWLYENRATICEKISERAQKGT